MGTGHQRTAQKQASSHSSLLQVLLPFVLVLKVLLLEIPCYQTSLELLNDAFVNWSKVSFYLMELHIQYSVSNYVFQTDARH